MVLLSDWLASYLDCRQQQVFYNGQLSPTQSITTGVPQGSVLVPLLFLVYVNELPNHIRESSVCMFADDTAIYQSETNIEEIEEKLNADFPEIPTWIKTNGLALNDKKTELMVIGTWKKLKHCDPIELFLDDVTITSIDTYKYLGVMLTVIYHGHLLLTKYVRKRHPAQVC